MFRLAGYSKVVEAALARPAILSNAVAIAGDRVGVLASWARVARRARTCARRVGHAVVVTCRLVGEGTRVTDEAAIALTLAISLAAFVASPMPAALVAHPPRALLRAIFQSVTIIASAQTAPQGAVVTVTMVAAAKGGDRPARTLIFALRPEVAVIADARSILTPSMGAVRLTGTVPTAVLLLVHVRGKRTARAQPAGIVAALPTEFIV